MREGAVLGRLDPNSSLYAPDDYEAVNELYFRDILAERTWAALPAGWHNPESAAARSFPLQSIGTEQAMRYSLDEGAALGALKHEALRVLSGWESRLLDWNEVTLSPSVSTANLVVLSALREHGIRRVVFETPAYFSTLLQAELLHLEIRRVASDRSHNFQPPIERIVEALGQEPCAIWLTQPKFGVGSNQPLAHLQDLRAVLRENDVLVLDEAADQTYPSLTSSLGAPDCQLIRTRGLLKGIGLNGLRVAAILHSGSWRAAMEFALEPAGGSLDRYGLENFAALAASSNAFQTLLSAANAQVTRLRKELDVRTLGSGLTPSALVNGYIGALFMDFTQLPGAYEDKRKALLEHCRQERMPVVLGASVGFAHDPSWEAIRINYFTSYENVMSSADVLVRALQALRHRLDR